VLVRIKNESFAKDVIAANQNRYSVDGKGEAVVEPVDAEVFYASGFVKIGEVDPKEHIRMPETPEEFLDSCQRLGITGADLRRMADFLDATNNMGPPEESREPEPLVIIGETEPAEEVLVSTAETVPPPMVVAPADVTPAIQETAETTEPEPKQESDPDQHVVVKAVKKPELEKLNRLSLMKRAKDMGLDVDGRWGKSRLIAAIRSKRDVSQETFNSL